MRDITAASLFAIVRSRRKLGQGSPSKTVPQYNKHLMTGREGNS